MLHGFCHQKVGVIWLNSGIESNFEFIRMASRLVKERQLDESRGNHANTLR